MKGDPLPDKDNVVRYVGGSKIADGIVQPEAFNNPPISVNWLEYQSGRKPEQVARVRRVLRLKIGKTAFLAELNVAAIRGLGFDVLEDPMKAENGWPPAPCHAHIVVISSHDREQKLMFEKLADIVVDIHPAYAETNPAA
ncbi:MAG: hypothetical protein OXE84_01205 [Rhodobacteraceae bacterium]|nr:hypothetical protein [Paracoccaceae bacterium]MCY4197700.1 hypothetical protein [Paracoccaceae bacterium]